MALSFSGGSALPSVGSAAYKAAAAAPSGGGSYNASTGVVSSGGSTVYSQQAAATSIAPAGWSQTAWNQQQADMAKYFPSGVTPTTVPSPAVGVVQPFNIPQKDAPQNYAGVVAGANAAQGATPATAGLIPPPISPIATKATAIAPVEKTFAQKVQEAMGLYQAPTSTADIYAQAERDAGIQQKQNAVRSYTNQINAITAKAQADTLSLTGQGRGVPEVIIGGQQAQVNKEAAIQVLPLQAQLSAAQGDLEQAQSHLDTLFKIRTADASAKNDYYNKIVDITYKEFTRQEQQKIDDIKTQRSQYQSDMTNAVNNTQSLATMALQNGNQLAYKNLTNIAAPDVTSPTFALDLVNYNKKVAQYGAAIQPKVAASTGAGGSNQRIDNERALMVQFAAQPIVKDYNEILSQKGAIDSYIQNGVGGPADLALVFSFMKGLDPQSVVRETEYANAAKSGNIFQGIYAKYNGYFKENGGFLPENVKKEFSNLVNQKLAVKEAQYTNAKKYYEDIAMRQGLDPRNVVVDYASGAVKSATSPAPSSPIVDSATKSATIGGQKYSFPTIDALNKFLKEAGISQ